MNPLFELQTGESNPSFYPRNFKQLKLGNKNKIRILKLKSVTE